MADGAPLKNHPLLRDDGFLPDGAVDTVLFAGYHRLGDATIRIYTSLRFDAWVEVPIDSVKAHTVDQKDDLTPSAFWVDRDAVVTRGTAETFEAQYLRGALASQELPASAVYSSTGSASWWWPFCSGTHT